MVISTSGYYQIVVICTLSADKKSINRKIVLSEPEPYLIGDAAAGGWDAQLADVDKFKLNAEGEYVSPVCKVGGKLNLMFLMARFYSTVKAMIRMPLR